jgi:hypothetical protein
MGDNRKPFTTRTGRVLCDAEIEALADEAERGYDVKVLKPRRRDRPVRGSRPAEIVPLRLDPERKKASEARAKAEHHSASAIIRQALRRFVDNP